MACCGGHETSNSNILNLFEHTSLMKSNLNQVLEIRKIHSTLQSYLNSKADEENQEQALIDLNAIEVTDLYRFKPTPTQTYRKLLSNITLCYWTATLSSILDSDSDHSDDIKGNEEKNKLKEILTIIPGFGDPTPQFTGEEVNDPSGRILNLKQIESLMRVGGFIFKGITRNDIALMWSELSEVGGSLWEENVIV